MPTYAQLQAEPYWGQEVVTPEMDWLGDELCQRTGRPRAAAGTKGDNHHLRGAHRSQQWILRSRYCTSRTYTVQAGLTAEQQQHLAGFDFTPGSAAEMVAQCKRIYAAMRAGLLDEVVEFFGNVNGDQVVDGWDNVRDRAASSDSSHLWHWHLTIDRRHCRNRPLMERILAIALGDPLESDMTPDQARQLDELHAALLDARKGGYGVPTVQMLRDASYSVVKGNTSTTWLGQTLLAIGQAAGIDPAELDAIRAAAREGAASAGDELVAAVLARLPADQALTRGDVEEAVRDAFAGGLAPSQG